MMTSRLRVGTTPLLVLVAILGAYTLLGVVYGILAPALEKPDEEWHYAYVQYLAQQGTLPPITTEESLNPALQEAGQPPLFYAAAAGVARVLQLDLSPPPRSRNPYWAYPARGTVNDNKNRFVHRPDEWREPSLRALFVLRLFSLVLGAGAVISAYGLARAVGAPATIALAAAAFIVLVPQYLFIAGSVSNDALVTALTGAALWALVIALRAGQRLRPWLVFGLLAGLASLTKVSALSVPLLGAAMAVIASIRRRDHRIAVTGVAASLGGLLVCTGWWYVHNMMRYGDPIGLRIHFAEYGRREALTMASLVSQVQAIESSFWAAFGWGNVMLPAWIYLGLRLAVLAALPGVALILLKPGRGAHQYHPLGLWAVVLCVVGMGASLALWTRTISASLGRLLFPALVPLVVLLTLGWFRVGRRLPALIVGAMVALAVLSPIYLARAYRPPTLLPDTQVPDGAQPIRLDFGDVARLYAFRVTPQRTAPGAEVGVTLCWQALSAPRMNYSVFVQLVGEANSIAGRRGTYPGLGSFATTLWRPGDSFCDLYRVPVNGDAHGPAVYAVEVGLFDLQTGDRMPATDAAGNDVEFVGVADVKLAGTAVAVPASATSVEADFMDKVTLLGYETHPAPSSAALSLTLYWRARAPMTVDYTVFLHVVDEAGKVVAQGDAPPVAGHYPTHWWDPGEVVADKHTIPLPEDLRPGDYRVLIGVYSPATGERLPRAGASGDIVEIGPFKLGPG
jgi:MFS family permease